MPHKFFADRRPHNGFTPEAYREITKREIENPDFNDPTEKKYFDYRKLNWQRTQRIYKSYVPSVEIIEVINSISESQIWMVITESWCGDSAQNLPYIEMLAKNNPLIDLRILLRDSNPDIIDLYLTNGKNRSIPKLVAFNPEGEELFQWGPRPKAAKDLVKKAIQENLSTELRNKQLHLWYAKNKGSDLEKELYQLLLNAKEFSL